MKPFTMFAAASMLVLLPAMGMSQKPAPTRYEPYFGPEASFTTPYLEEAAKNYVAALKSDNDGVVESAIAYTTYFRIVAPEFNLAEVRANLVELAESGKTPVIRYKASLALLVFDSPVSFDATLSDNHTTGDQFLASVASQVHKNLLGHNVK